MKSFRELLIVLIFMGTLLTLGSKALSTAGKNRMICADNLRKIYQIASEYSNDHDGMIVPLYTRHGVKKQIFWPDKLLDYVSDVSIFYCPADKSGSRNLKKYDLLPMKFSVSNVSYGLNYYIASSKKAPGVNNPYNIRMVADPGYVIYFGDARFIQLRPTKWCWKSDYNPVHSKGANYVMADGHVEYFTGKNPGLMHEFDGWKKDVKRWKNWK